MVRGGYVSDMAGSGSRLRRLRNPQRKQQPSSDSNSNRFAAFETPLKILSYIASIASLIGVTVIGLLAKLGTITHDPWAIGVAICVTIMIPLIFLVAYAFTSRQALSISNLGEEIKGRSQISSREKELIAGASDSIAYIAGDFSHVREIQSELLAAYNRGVTIRILAADSDAPAVIANLRLAIDLHCRVKVYDKNARRIKAVIVDADQAAADGALMFVKKTSRDENREFMSGTGIPGDDTQFSYIGRVYDYSLLVTAVGQMFDAWWEKAQHFAPRTP